MAGFFTKYFGSTVEAEVPFSVLDSLISMLGALSEAFSEFLSETNANLLLNESLPVTDAVEGVLPEVMDDVGD